MPRFALSSVAAALTAAAALGITACGGEDAKLLQGETAREITANLDTVQQLSDEGDCVGAESAVQQVGEQIETLEGVDRQLKAALEGGATRLEEVIAECDEEVESLAPTTEETTPAETEKEAEKREKEEEKAEKEAEKEEKERRKEEEMTQEEPALPPQANGKGKGNENGNGPPVEEEAPSEGDSGGVSPGSPAEGE